MAEYKSRSHLSIVVPSVDEPSFYLPHRRRFKIGKLNFCEVFNKSASSKTDLSLNNDDRQMVDLAI